MYCGIEIKGSEAIIALVEMSEGLPALRASDIKKLKLQDDESADAVKAFIALVESLVREHQVQKVFIKKRGKVGEFAGGAVTFKIEGLIQANSVCAVELLAAPTIAAAVRRHDLEAPDALNKYQHEAFFCACTGALKSE